MVVYRFGRWRYTIRWRWLRMPFSFLYKVLKPISEVLTGIELPCEVTLGRRFRIDHFGGIVISGDAVFGDDCVIRNGVTVGLKHTGYRGAPTLGNRVDVGAGAKILGPIRIGDDVFDRSQCGGTCRRAFQLHCGWGSGPCNSEKGSDYNGERGTRNGRSGGRAERACRNSLKASGIDVATPIFRHFQLS